MDTLKNLLLALILSIVVTSCGSESVENQTIKGYVTDDPVSGARVMIWMPTQNIIFGEGTTDSNGFYTVDIDSNYVEEASSEPWLDIVAVHNEKVLRGRIINYSGTSYQGEDTYVTHYTESAIQLMESTGNYTKEVYETFIAHNSNGVYEMASGDEEYDVVNRVANIIQQRFNSPTITNVQLTSIELHNEIKETVSKPGYAEWINP